ncbi:MAG: hypothetical protein JWQ38_2396, partial [Flavipsychrobacter sp.]|nr:hypothetical protein [Flavipsychrobacter sp.]
TGVSVVSSATVTTTYTIVGIDASSCTNMTTTLATVYPIPPAPGVTSPAYYCQHNAAWPLTATGTNLLWYTAATGGLGNSSAPMPSTDNTDTTTWYVSQTVNGCESPRVPIVVIIRINAQPDFSFNIRYGCISDTVQFTNTSKNSIGYLWDFGDHTTDTATNPVHYYHPVMTNTDFNVVLHAYNKYCFADSMLEVLTLSPTTPLVLENISTDQSIDYGTSVQLNVDGAVSYAWTPDNDYLNNIHIHNPIATPKDDTVYIVTGIDARGCVDTAQVRITIEYDDNPVLPSGFTPNNDGDNDLSRILNLKYNKLLYFRIYNRWGQVVFYSTDVNAGWDGTFNGVPQELGVYDYVFSTAHPNGKHVKVYKGNITLIR